MCTEDDFKHECDLYVACLILQKQIECIDGKKENIIIPWIKMKQIREQTTNIIQPIAPTSDDQQQSISTAVLKPCVTCMTEAKCLAGIQLSGSDGVCKKYEFTYSYFEDNTTSLKGYLATAYSIIQSDRKRLKLEKLQEKTCNGTISIPAHVFEYYNEL